MRLQSGFSLLVSIFILSIISVGALFSMQRATLQERILVNVQQQQELFDVSQFNLNYFFNLLIESPNKLTLLSQIIEEKQKDISYLSSNNYDDIYLEMRADLLDLETDKYNPKSTNGFSNKNFIYYHFSTQSTAKNKLSDSAVELEIGIRLLTQRP